MKDSTECGSNSRNSSPGPLVYWEETFLTYNNDNSFPTRKILDFVNF